MIDSTITTYDGHEEHKDHCVFIRGKYYHKERDCTYYEGTYYSPFSRYLVLDNETNKKVHSLNAKLNFGVINYINGKYILGYYSKNIIKNCNLYLPTKINTEEFNNIISEISSSNQNSIVSDNIHQNIFIDIMGNSFVTTTSTDDIIEYINCERLVKCMDINKFINNETILSMNCDSLCNINDIKSYNKFYIDFNKISAITPYDFNLSYNSETMMQTFQSSFENNKFNMSENSKSLSKYIKDFTFGVEYETWDGRIPTYLCATNGLIPVRDGSLRHDGICGFEYASVIMNGLTGLNAIKSQCEALNKYTIFNEKCSMHIHVGNIERTKDNLIKLYQAFYSIQDSIYSMFPSCLKHTSEYKLKDYCSPLPLMPDDENAIVKWLSDETELFKHFGRNHPRDINSQSKWHINSRYSICNLNNFYYTDRGTVELRISTPTFNHNKVVALLLLVCLIVDEAINNKFYSTVEELINATMDGNEKDWMINYIKFRQDNLSLFKKDENGNVKYFETMKNDNETGNDGDIA